ncbi:hypothetical protein BN7_6707 [Wickerhamomyces ciferrii]|uniref:aminodeoxychorismate synthase n=1 Tax=Wickerhamomyces ciferrii (strain ATCC 14091 / BCRC 22168 / CBS 111 / JCM 3599 / NBRC 0793 / NRRL Y-1031 F-60-10) TaxID=1206466 RepID=K0KYD9_WICCF|nr:uncharacterized protein BN7_6707 [Wickerhamomyces ciferrii]CCH47097.1 hypothetical protein BN7_6707 [Wickerhamomyces ciferrii]
MTILLIDSYDSFTYNLRSLIEEASGEKVITIHNDSLPVNELSKYLDLFSAIIVGPGPGHPKIASDVGVIPDLFNDVLTNVKIPILGICLGFQSLCLSQGCNVDKLNSIKHGQVYKVEHHGDQLFQGIEQGYKSVRYHSLHVPKLSDSLKELAYCDDEGEKIIMAVKHKDYPWYGVQYHPESICSENGSNLIVNFIEIAKSYNKISRDLKVNDKLIDQLISSIDVRPLIPISNKDFSSKYLKTEEFQSHKTALEICETLQQNNREFLLLNSASFPGTWSIIGLPNANSLRVTHSTENNEVIYTERDGKKLKENCSSVWEYISEIMERKMVSNDTDFPFIGGFMGIFSYEEGDHIHISNLPKITKENIPDTKLIFIENLILVNNFTKKTYILSIGDDNFIQDIKPLLNLPITLPPTPQVIKTNDITRPDELVYKQQFEDCQKLLASGDSYELCLTSSTKLKVPKETDPWMIYKTLTKRNPAPYSAYMNFDDCILISSSPERFISWDDIKCELRPIKGTVKKTEDMTFEKASAILNTPKEIGENLMIVDLIRHDLYQLLDKVEVSKLMSVEEYSTVFQLVSIIKGYFSNTSYSGIDILSRSLPPGSMTGAPKKRSVELLQDIEGARRGIYSGVCGYWSIDNKADWSVIIRSIFHYKSDLENDDVNNLWRIGAGGAITVLSDSEGEWQELLTKLDSALQAFTN